MMGYSAGAWMASMSGLAADLSTMDQNDPIRQTIMQGADFDPNLVEIDESSQIQSWVSISGGLPPTLTNGFIPDLLPQLPTRPAPGYMFHGTDDPGVPLSWDLSNREAIMSTRPDTDAFVMLKTFPGADHVDGMWSHMNEFMSQSANFLYWTLRLDDAPHSFDQIQPPVAG